MICHRRSIALARALIRRPSLLLIDEPFSALDALLRAKMRRNFSLIFDSSQLFLRVFWA